MIALIEPVYREQTAQAFKYALEADEPLSLMTYSFLDEEDLDTVVTAPLNPLTNQQILSRQDDMRRRLNGRCKGLLEVVSISSNAPHVRQASLYVDQFNAPKVVFLHRTVRDFLHTKGMQNMLLEHLEPSFEAKSRICKASLAELKAINYSALEGNDWLPLELLEILTYYARRLEGETHVSQSSLIDEVGRCVSEQANPFGWGKDQMAFLKFIVKRGLHLYIAETLTTTTSLKQSDKSTLLGALLEDCLISFRHSPTRWDTEMVDILLKHGAQPNDKYRSSTVWGNFLEFLSPFPVHSNSDGLLRTVESLLSHGANLQQHIVTGQRTQTKEVSKKKTRSQKHQEVRSDIIKTAQQILLEFFVEEKTLEMLKRVRKDQKVLPSRSKWWSGRSLRASMKALKV